MTIRVGSVPYLNALPLVAWFHSAECDADIEIIYAVPSELARMLRENQLDVANCSIFEGLQTPNLTLVPGISISSNGPVQSVRLFSNTPTEHIRTVALDNSSLTSSALTKILLSENFGVYPQYCHHPPNIQDMLALFDAGLIIGELRDFGLPPEVHTYDLGAGWQKLTGLPFVFAGWLARNEAFSSDMVAMLVKAMTWGTERIVTLASGWAYRYNLPFDLCFHYLSNTIQYNLNQEHMKGLLCFQKKCLQHGLLLKPLPLVEGVL